MEILRSGPKVVKAQPQHKPSKELINRIGQRPQPAAPSYGDSAKLVNAFVWRPWTQHICSHTHWLFPSWAEANRS
jgi:hypothetical protein